MSGRSGIRAGAAGGITAEGEHVQVVAGAPTRVRGVAYSGAPMRLDGWQYPVVIDLAGLEIPASVPLLTNHENRTSARVGMVRARVEDGALVIEGEIVSTSGLAQGVIEQAKAGADWQLSIGAEPVDVELVKGRRTVNGQAVDGPFHHVKRARLREISILPVGADAETRLRIAATFNLVSGGITMNEELKKYIEARGFDVAKLTEEQITAMEADWKASLAAESDSGKTKKSKQPKRVVAAAATEPEPEPEPVVDPTIALRAAAAAETKRIAAVQKLCTGHLDLQAQAIAEGWDETKTELEVLRASRPKLPIDHVRETAMTPQVIEAALVMAGGLKPEKAYSDQVLDAAHKQFRHGIGLQEVLLMAARANGYVGPMVIRSGNLREVLQAAFAPIQAAQFSTTELSGILSNTANKYLLDGFNAVESTWRAIASIRPVTDFKAITSYRLTGNLEYEEVGEDGELKHGVLNEESLSNQAKTYGKILVISRQDIINDDLGALSVVPRRLGRGAALAFNSVFWTAFMDNATFFTAARGNFDDGADSALDVDALTAAELLFLDQTDPDGDPLGILPATLLVPNALNVTAAQLMASLELGRDDEGPTTNPHAGKFTVQRSSYLSNSGITGYSTTAWYLLANPADLSVVEVVFLNGKDSPTVESADADFNVLGVQMRGYHDFGVTKQEYRAGVKMAGA